MKTTVYSFADVKAVMYHQDVGQCVLSSQGLGKISISMSGDLSSHTATADGYVVVNRLKNNHGTITIEVPQNSSSDEYLRSEISEERGFVSVRADGTEYRGQHGTVYDLLRERDAAEDSRPGL